MAGRYRAYPEYKDSGLKWFGDIPSFWDVSRLKFEAVINMGQSPSSDDCNTDGFGLPFLQGNAEFSKEHPIPKQYCNVARKIAQSGDLLFSVRAPVGAINIADQPYGIGRGLCAISVRHNIDDRYLKWLVPVCRTELDSIATGSTFEAVSAEQVENVAIALPSRDEQIIIANFLDYETAKIDTLIDKQQQLIKLLKEKRQAVISHAVTKGLNPTAPMKDSGVEWLGEVPEHWGMIPLNLIVSTRKGIAFKSDDFTDCGIRVVKASDIKNLTINSSDVFLPEKFSDQYPKAVLKEGDIILSTVGSTPDVKNSAVGQIGVVPKELDGSLLNQNTVVLNPNKNSIENVFLAFVLQTTGYRDHLDLHAHGTANQASLNISDMIKFIAPLPSMAEQKEIAQKISTTLEIIGRLELSAESAQNLLKERRTALISAAVTGKIDVRNWQPAG